MAVITLSNIKKAFGNRDLFEDTSFFVNERERVSLIGANGTGKTTLLRIICGEESADSGTVNMEPGVTVGYLPQEVDLPEIAEMFLAVMGVTPELLACASELADLEVKIKHAAGDEAHKLGSHYAEVSHKFDSLHGFDYQISAKAILLGLGFDESDLSKPVRALSGGQKTRAALARLLLLSPDLLLLDEPTNHLDLDALVWLEAWLKRYAGTMVVISHDREFLDAVTAVTLHIDNAKLVRYGGNYSTFEDMRAEQMLLQQSAMAKQADKIAHLQKFIDRFKAKASKAKQAQSRVKALERLTRIAPAHVADGHFDLEIEAPERSPDLLLRADEMSFAYGEKTLFQNVSLTLRAGARIALLGP
ncbi:MAG: ATP-binding cassette domain-containing protein, partial [Armatimonadota bacterium]